jgi:Flp pilus assembly protein TadB
MDAHEPHDREHPVTALLSLLTGASVVGSGAALRPAPIRVAMLRAQSRARAPTRARPRVAPFAAGLACAIGLLAGGAYGAAVTVVAIVCFRAWSRRRARRRAEEALWSHYPDFIDLLVLTIRSGCTPLQALQSLDGLDEPLQGAVSDVIREVHGGARFADAISVLATRLGGVAQPLADAFALADRYGTPLPPVLDRLADEARAQRRRDAEGAARQLPIRLSFPLVGCTLPAFVLLTIVPLMAGTLSSLRGLMP